ncbi:2Fe-2S iron-sulfur cluster-binding protein [Sandarakinorhabdus sp.]|uniref:(2Fe-2S)-binding protein n=1 Tax=Sandarakinorhabdus sp. TaxID=1916663 RepID=UPI00286E3F57|nr:2Fe-2S iron-sulfur cluster-binding protein [Sandarakinorhabdus sp.]
MQMTLTINGQSHSVDAPAAALLVDVLRDDLGLTGTHIGCDTSQCGACNVLVDGVGMKACTMLAAQAQGASITTIEGIGKSGGTLEALHPMQLAFREAHGLQCGFCTPGMVMAGMEMVRKHGTRLTPELVTHELEGNLCRCTGYINIVKAIVAGAAGMEASHA